MKLCFGLGLPTKFSTKLLKIPIALLRWINIGFMFYLDDMLLMGEPYRKLWQREIHWFLCCKLCQKSEKVDPKTSGTIRISVQAVLRGKIQFFVSSNRTKYQIFLGLSQTRIYLVDSEQKAIHWQKSSTVGTSDDYPNRCFHKSVGSTLNLNRGVNGRNMKRNTT